MSTCNTDKGDTPVGGQGMSSKCSRIYFIPPDCSAGILLDGTPPTGTAKWFSEQVIRIEVRAMTSVRSYGHDKSFCAQDATPGIDSYSGVITTRLQCCDPMFTCSNGTILWLQVYPQGDANKVIEGYALITEAPIIMNLETGDPVERNYTFVSKGQWTTDAAFITSIRDCCNCCEGGIGSSGMQDVRLDTEFLVKEPVTVYQFTDKGEWSVAYDECEPGMKPGPKPEGSGQFVGELKFVKCLAV